VLYGKTALTPGAELTVYGAFADRKGMLMGSELENIVSAIGGLMKAGKGTW